MWYRPELDNQTNLGSIAAFAVDRTPASRTGWRVTKRIDFTECLTANGPALHFLSLGNGGATLDRSAFVVERARLQGFPEGYITEHDSAAAVSICAIGNAMSVPVIASAVYRELAYIMHLPPISSSPVTLKRLGIDVYGSLASEQPVAISGHRILLFHDMHLETAYACFCHGSVA